MKKLHHLTYFILTCLFTPISFSQPYDVYVSDVLGHKIIKYNQDGGDASVFIETGSGGLNRPQDILFLEEDSLVLVPSLTTNDVKKYHSRTGEYLGNWAYAAQPTRIAIGPEDTLIYLLQWSGTNRVLRYEFDGTFVDEFTSFGVPTSIGLDWDEEGNLYVSSYTGNYIRKFDDEGNDLGVFANENVIGPTNIWFEDDGNLVVANYNNNELIRFNSDGEYLEVYSSGYSNPEGVAFLPDGNLLIGDRGSGAVKRTNGETGAIIDDFVSAGGILVAPNAVVIRETGFTNLSENQLPVTFLLNEIGLVFKIHPASNLAITNVEIFDLQGRLIDTKAIDSEIVWDAYERPNGTYIIMAKTSDGSILKQQVIVKK